VPGFEAPPVLHDLRLRHRGYVPEDHDRLEIELYCARIVTCH